MIDPEVVRLRRLRREALLLRDIARAFESPTEAGTKSVFSQCGRAGWRVARTVSGRLRSHPYAEYQKDASIASQLRNRLHARFLALTKGDRLRSVRMLELALQALARQLDDSIALGWSSDFSDALGRARSEIAVLGVALARETGSGMDLDLEQRLRRPSRAVEQLEAAFDKTWPYLAF